MSEQTKAIKWWNTHTTEQCFNLRKSLLNESLFGEVSKSLSKLTAKPNDILKMYNMVNCG